MAENNFSDSFRKLKSLNLEELKAQQARYEAHLLEHPEETFEFQLKELVSKHFPEIFTDSDFEEIAAAAYEQGRVIMERRTKEANKHRRIDSFG